MDKVTEIVKQREFCVYYYAGFYFTKIKDIQEILNYIIIIYMSSKKKQNCYFISISIWRYVHIIIV